MAETEALPNISKAQVKTLFSNVDQLLPMNQHLLGEISGRLDAWRDDQLIGDIFEKAGPFFKIYSIHGTAWSRVQEMLTQCLSDTLFVEQVKTLEQQQSCRTSLSDLLERPKNRISKYIEALKDLQSKTDQSHSDYAHLSKALLVLEGVRFAPQVPQNSGSLEKVARFSPARAAAPLTPKLERSLDREVIDQFSIPIREQDKEASLGNLKKKLTSGGLFKDTKLDIWLSREVMALQTNQKSKKKTNVASIKYVWPLEIGRASCRERVLMPV